MQDSIDIIQASMLKYMQENGDSIDSIQASMLKYMQENRDAFSKKLEAADTLDFQGGVMAGPIKKLKQTTMMSRKIDKHLEEKLYKHLGKLRKKIDWIGDKELRQKLDEHATAIHNIIKEAVDPTPPNTTEKSKK